MESKEKEKEIANGMKPIIIANNEIDEKINNEQAKDKQIDNHPLGEAAGNHNKLIALVFYVHPCTHFLFFF